MKPSTMMPSDRLFALCDDADRLDLYETALEDNGVYPDPVDPLDDDPDPTPYALFETRPYYDPASRQVVADQYDVEPDGWGGVRYAYRATIPVNPVLAVPPTVLMRLQDPDLAA